MKNQRRSYARFFWEIRGRTTSFCPKATNMDLGGIYKNPKLE